MYLIALPLICYVFYMYALCILDYFFNKIYANARIVVVGCTRQTHGRSTILTGPAAPNMAIIDPRRERDGGGALCTLKIYCVCFFLLSPSFKIARIWSVVCAMLIWYLYAKHCVRYVLFQRRAAAAIDLSFFRCLTRSYTKDTWKYIQ